MSSPFVTALTIFPSVSFFLSDRSLYHSRQGGGDSIFFNEESLKEINSSTRLDLVSDGITR